MRYLPLCCKDSRWRSLPLWNSNAAKLGQILTRGIEWDTGKQRWEANSVLFDWRTATRFFQRKQKCRPYLRKLTWDLSKNLLRINHITTVAPCASWSVLPLQRQHEGQGQPIKKNYRLMEATNVWCTVVWIIFCKRPCCLSRRIPWCNASSTFKSLILSNEDSPHSSKTAFFSKNLEKEGEGKRREGSKLLKIKTYWWNASSLPFSEGGK